ncbi:GNAT family N-acetyltransferase [Erwinia sp. V71]|uniref:GNAT family N-acetyltransferase n=1 Tax=Erwinia sp. V71 TaxID=3369424 RepID=UPI003F5DCBEC
MSITLRAMTADDLDAAFVLTQLLKWPHRRADWQQALQLGNGIVAEENGVLTGTILCCRWGEDYATIGLVIVADAAQGRSIGKQLMLAALERLAGSNVRLHATEAGKGLYEKLGFVVTGAVEQHQCRELAQVTVLPPAAHQQRRAAQPQDAARLTQLDQQASGQQRARLTDELLTRAERVLLLEQDGVTTGFAALRRFGHGYAIGPIVAQTLPDAKVLVSQLLSGLTGQFVRIDCDAHCGLGDWLNQLGLPQVDAPTTMVKGTPWQPDADGAQVFGLMSQAMG